jgi:N-acyl homoserine lactone hydrolase
VTGVVYQHLARFHIAEHETLDGQLAALGYAAADVGTAVVSHLHQDHIGGLAELKQAEVMVSADEWRELSGFAPEARGFLREHIQIPGLHWTRFGFEPAAAGR